MDGIEWLAREITYMMWCNAVQHNSPVLNTTIMSCVTLLDGLQQKRERREMSTSFTHRATEISHNLKTPHNVLYERQEQRSSQLSQDHKLIISGCQKQDN